MIDERTKELIAIGASITAHCLPCLDYHVARARESGAGDGTILAAIDVGKQVRRGAGLKMDRHAAALAAASGPSAAADDCAPAPAPEALDGIEGPVLLLRRDPRQVVAANPPALALFGKGLPAVAGHRGGEVFDCLHAFSAAGCGQDAPCATCAIKGAIVDTFETGTAHARVAAALPVRTAGAAAHCRIQVSTEKAGEHVRVHIERYDLCAGSPEQGCCRGEADAAGAVTDLEPLAPDHGARCQPPKAHSQEEPA